MPKQLTIAVFEGDGIGPEIMAPTLSVLDALSNAASYYSLTFRTVPAGAAHYAETGESLPDTSLAVARESDAILLSAMGLPEIRYPDGTEISPQIELRKKLGLYAGLRPVKLMPNQPSPLSSEGRKPIDFVLIRESTEGLFFSQGAGTVTEMEATETLKITRPVSEKLFEFAFRLAKQRKDSGRSSGHVTCVDKANVFRAFAFFRSIFYEIAEKHPEIKTDHAYVDAAALWMVQKPHVFDVLVTENMFGDILSDLGAGLMGGLGLAPSADIGDDAAVFQPCHGSAPDIAGHGIANPMAMMLSAAMMLNWLGYEHDLPALIKDGERLETAVERMISAKVGLTADLGGTATTNDVGTSIIRLLKEDFVAT
ncbi:MAG: isocitrate/isopropylmalate family dehydrogenase [Pseudomonadota bacterium]